MLYSKLGPHVMPTGQFEVSRWLINAPPSVAKFILPVDDGFWGGARVSEVNDCQPETIVIGKPLHGAIILGVGLGEEYRAGYTPEQVALAAWDKYQAPLLQAYPRVDYWEWFNEFEHDTELMSPGPQYTWYALCCAEMARLLFNAGKKAAICALATHRPDTSQYPNWAEWFVPALRACRLYNAVFSRHGYDAGIPDINGSLRYRSDLREFANLGYSDVKMVLTECGWDWPPIHPRGKSMPEYVSEYCIPLDLAMRDDPNILGGTLYCHGTGGANQQFDTADPKGAFVDSWIAWAKEHPMTNINPPTGEWRITNCTALNVRRWPWIDGPRPDNVVKTLPAGTLVSVENFFTCNNKVWALLKSDDRPQWISAYYLEEV